MILKSIEMSNFRNYEREEFHFHEGTNVLYGDNAQGKTNVLEAIYLWGHDKVAQGKQRFGHDYERKRRSSYSILCRKEAVYL